MLYNKAIFAILNEIQNMIKLNKFNLAVWGIVPFITLLTQPKNLHSDKPTAKYSENVNFTYLNIRNENILGIAETSNKQLWIITEKSIYVSADNAHTFIKYYADQVQNPTTIKVLKFDNQEYVLIGSKSGLFVYWINKNEFLPLKKDKLGDKEILQVFENKNVVYILVKSNDAIPVFSMWQNLAFETGPDAFYSDDIGLPLDTDQVFIDSQDNWWFMSIAAGLWRYSSDYSSQYHVPIGSDTVVNSISETPEHDLIIATKNNGIWEKRNNLDIYTQNSSISSTSKEYDISQAITNNKYEITYLGIDDAENNSLRGLYETSYQGTPTTIEYNKVAELNNLSVTSLFVDDNSNMFIGSTDANSGKVYLYYCDYSTPAPTPSSDTSKTLSPTVIIAIIAGSVAAIAVATIAAVFFFKRRKKFN